MEQPDDRDDSNDRGEGTSQQPQHDVGVLRLRGAPGHRQRVTWEEGTVDNEFLNRKKSKSERCA